MSDWQAFALIALQWVCGIVTGWFARSLLQSWREAKVRWESQEQERIDTVAVLTATRGLEDANASLLAAIHERMAKPRVH